MQFFSANTEYLHSAFRECNELMNSVLKVLRLLYVYSCNATEYGAIVSAPGIIY